MGLLTFSTALGSTPDVLSACANRTASDAVKAFVFPTSIIKFVRAVRFSSLWRFPDAKKSVRKNDAAIYVANEISGLRKLVAISATSATIVMILTAETDTLSWICGSVPMSICDLVVAARWMQIKAVCN